MLLRQSYFILCLNGIITKQIIDELEWFSPPQVGLVGNVFCLLVLYPDRYKKTKGLFYGYLSVLAGTDIVWLISNLVFRYN